MSVQIARRIFTVDEYHRMGEAGVFSEDDHVDLIEGEILKKSPIGGRHAASFNRLTKEFNNLLGVRAIVSVQNPIMLNDVSEPEPDLAILRPRDDFYGAAHPTASDVLLVIEGGDTSAYDLKVKLPAYARSGIPQVWIADLTTETVEVHSELLNDS